MPDNDKILGQHIANIFDAIDGLPAKPYTYGGTILYYDGPKVFWLATADNRALLVEAAAEEDDEYQELAVIIDRPELEASLRGDVEFRDAWIGAKAEDLYLIHYPHSETQDIWVSKPPHPLPDRLLPAPGAHL